MLALVLSALSLSAYSVASAQQRGARIQLSDEEAEWIRRNPKIVVGYWELQAPPYIYTDDGGLHGIGYDYLLAFADRIGVQVETRRYESEAAEWKDVCASKVDVVTNVVLQGSLGRCFIFGHPYTSVPMMLVGRANDARLSDPELRGLTISAYMGEHEPLVAAFPAATIEPQYSDKLPILEVAEGRADGFITDAQFAMQLIADLKLTNLVLVRKVDTPPFVSRLASPLDRGPLMSALNRAFRSMTPEERAEIDARWYKPLPQVNSTRAILSDEEKKTLSASTRIAVSSQSAPLSALREDGNVDGVAGSYIGLLQESGAILDVIGVHGSREFRGLMQSESVDVVLGVVEDNGRAGRWIQSKPYASIPNVIVVRSDAGYSILGIQDLAEKRIAVGDNERLLDHILLGAPGCDVRVVDSDRTGLEGVLAGDVDAYVGNLATIDYLLRSEFPGRLHISAPAGFDDKLVLAARSTHAPMVTTFNRILDGLGEEGRAQVRNRWLSVEYISGVRWGEEARWAVPLALAILTGFYILALGYVRLRSEVRARHKAEARLQEVDAHLPAVVYQLRRSPCGQLSFTFIFGDVQAHYGVTGVAAMRDAMLLFTRIHAEDRTAVKQMIDAAALDVGPLDVQFRVAHEEGWSWIHSRAVAMRATDGSVLWSGYWTDVTLERTQAHALEVALAARSDFLAMMSHEIRTPMAGILGLLEVLGHDIEDPDQLRVLGIIDESAQMLRQLLDDILDLSRLEAGVLRLDPSPTDLRELVTNIAHLLRVPADQKGLVLKLHVADTFAAAHLVDGMRLRQILFNLVSNAIKFTATGSITIALQVVEDDVLPGWHDLRLSVSDTGIGIAEEHQALLFQPFVQGDHSINRRFGGTGLGLSICRRLVEQMEGEITLNSVVAVGTRIEVRLRLPVVVDAAAEAVKVDKAGATSMMARHRILVAEDQDVNRILMAWRLQQLGVECVIVSDGQEALNVLLGGTFDLLITDCRMPLMDGIELVGRIRAHERATGNAVLPVIAMTAGGMPDQVAACLAAGMNEVLLKPATLDQLATVLRRWLPGHMPEASVMHTPRGAEDMHQQLQVAGA